ncbi:MAG: AAA family ATPase [Bryobacteraceae bacterium]|nr:AAA family ATPase [Bryobacteraceae bacterium]
MTVSHLTVEKFRCFLNRVDLPLDPKAFTVLYGPNASGKSTLLQALIAALANAHSAKGRAMETLRPWDTNLAPEVTVAFEHGGAAWRVWKRFLDRPQCRLEKLAARGHYRLQAEGKAADQQLAELLGLEPAPGAAGVEAMGVAQILWAPQGELELPALSGRALEDVRAILGAQLGGRLGPALECWVAEQYGQFWTPTGKPKKSREQEKAALRELEHRLDEARVGLAHLEELAGAAEIARREAAELHRQASAIRSELEEALQQEKNAELLRAIVGNLEAQARLKEKDRHELLKRIEQIRDLSARIAELQQAERNVETSVEQKRQAERLASQQAADAKARSDTLAAQIDRLRRTEQLARRLEQLLGEQRAVAERVARVEELEQQLDQERRRLEALRAPSEGELATIRQLHDRLRELDIRLEALLLKAELVPELEADVEVIEGAPAGRHRLVAGAPFRITAQGRMELHLAGFGQVRLLGPETSAPQLQRDREATAAQLRSWFERFGTDQLAELASRQSQHAEIQSRIDRLQTERQTLLAGSTSEELNQRLARLQHEAAEIVREEPALGPSSSDELRRLAEQSGREMALKQQEAETARREWEHAHHEWQSLCSALEVEESKLQMTRQELARARQELIACQHDGRTPEERERDLQRLELEWKRIHDQLEKARDELARSQPGRAAALKAQVQVWEQRLAQAEQRRLQAEADSRALFARGPYEQYSNLETEVERRRRAVESVELHAEAVRRLHEAVLAAKEEMLEGLAEPVAAEAARILARIAGRPMGTLSLSPDFTVASVQPESAGRDVDLGELSGGEREQLYLAVRLALARFLAQRERQLVVLDDVLTATDSERLGRLFDLLSELQESLQILILTCHPERFRALPGARFVRLENFALHAEESQDVRGRPAADPYGESLSSSAPDAGRAP